MATTSSGAKALMSQVNGSVATDMVGAWANWLRARSDVTGKLGTVGWCFGGG